VECRNPDSRCEQAFRTILWVPKNPSMTLTCGFASVAEVRDDR